jgi:Cdc6-like AAA superfamily ATPase
MSTELWKGFGFSGNPYQATPLAPTEEDYGLFVGREDTGIDFRTQIEAEDGCTVVLSGDVGVGKTSLFNIQQYLLFSGKSEFGPKLVPALELTPLDMEDTPTGLARRCVHNAVQSIERFCSDQSLGCPKQITKIKKWLSHTGSAKGFDFGLQILGSGGNVAMSFDAPPVSEATLENWRDVMRAIASETKETLGYSGLFVALDNAENVENQQLAELLMSFRDTLFTVPGVWWVIIGQSGLYSLIDAADKRISQRIQGTGLEIEPLTAEELHTVIERRVRKFRAKKDAASPISREVHTRLYDASRGEIRFVLKTSDALVRRVVADLRKQAAEIRKAGGEKFEKIMMDLLTERLIEGQLPDELMNVSLRALSYHAINDLRLKRKELEVLRQIGGGEARASDHAQFKVKTMQDFSSNYLTKMFKSNLLNRRQAGRAVYYSLRGFAALAHEFDIWDELIESAE